MTLFTDYIAGIYCLIIVALTLAVGREGYAQSVQGPAFENINFNPQIEGSSNLVSEIIQDDLGYLWIACQNGLFRYNGTHLKRYNAGIDTTSLSSNNTTALFLDMRGRIWVGTGSSGIDLYDPVTDRFLPNADPLRNDLRIWDFYQPDSLTFWIGAKDYLVHYDLKSDTCRYFDLPTSSQHNNAVRSILPDIANPDKLWLATIFGLWSFDTESYEFRSYDMPPELTRPEITNGAYLLMDLIQKDADNIWASTWGGGVLNFHVPTGVWTPYKNLPPHKDPNRWLHVVFQMLQNGEDEFWVATSHGFGTFNLNTNIYSLFEEGPTPKLQHSFNYNGLCTTTDGRVVVGRYGGFSISEPLTTAATASAYAPEITSVKVDGRDYPTDTALNFIHKIEIDEDEQDVAFSIATPGIFDISDIIYSYKLEGYDKDWITATGGQFRYTNLSPGSYTLHIRTGTDSTNWSYGRNTVKLEKAGHFWQYPIFYIICTLLLFLIVGLIYWFNIRSIKQTARIKSEYDRKIAGIEMAALRAQMNPHFMFNSLNSIKAYILKEKTDEASAYLTKFSKLMRAVLRNSKSQLVSLKDEMSALKLYVELESLRFEGEFKYDFDIQPAIKADEIVMPPLLVQPYVENAIRHGLLEKEEGLKHLLIKVELSGPDEILIIVQDNGIGRSAASKKKPINPSENRSYGMEITGDRIALIEQTLGIHADVNIIDLHDDSGAAAGTRVELRVPLIPASEVLT